uniref:pantoate--beta-alanine ligase n=1 Tax=Flavobacterium sp. TaxID=239 RepID=UPI00404B2482
MLVFESQKLIFAHLNTAKNESKTIGFVPTMGALHEGHLSLIQNAAQHNDIVVVSIFVNPTQFNNPEDLQKYPRTLADDLDKIKAIQPDCVVFTPSIDEIYEGNTTTESFDFGVIASQMEGKFRPGHFDGVGTIVKKLFQITQPNKAYFGEKDFQQLQIIKKLVTLENISVEIVPCAIYREENGLAMSSRNERLNSKHREEAKFIYALLQDVLTLFKTQNLDEINSFVTNKISEHPDFTLEYFEIASEETLETMVVKNESQNYRAFIAVYANKIRLIDNISLK